MIKNIVFDLGGVLVDFNPKRFLASYGIPELEIDFYKKLIFSSEEWDEYNKGKYLLADVKEMLINKNPDYKEKLNYIFDNFDNSKLLSEKTDTKDFLKELKSSGLKIYILSDLNETNYNYNIKMDWARYVDGGVYSHLIGTLKPDKNNYLTLLKTYNLNPSETIFIDDRLNNVEAANSLGIHGIQFTTLAEVKEKVNDLIKK